MTTRHYPLIGRLILAVEQLLVRFKETGLFCVLWLVGTEVRRSEVRDRSYPVHWEGWEIASGLATSHVEFLWHEQESASNHTDEKIRQLLGLSSAFAAAILVFSREAEPRWLFVVILAFLAIVVFICMEGLGVRVSAMPEPIGGPPHNRDAHWAREVGHSLQRNSASHAYRVDLYRAARRWFLAVLLLMPVTIAVSYSRPVTSSRIPSMGGASVAASDSDGVRTSLRSPSPGARIVDYGDTASRSPAPSLPAPRKVYVAPPDTLSRNTGLGRRNAP